MNGPFRLYRRCDTKEEADALASEFEKEGIETRVTENSEVVDITFLGSPRTEFHVLIPRNMFEQADQILSQDAMAQTVGVAADHYLFGFSDEELIDVLRRRDEWTVLDVELARRILSDRGIQITDQELADWRDARMRRLSAPERIKWWWLLMGYVFAFAGGFVAIIMGLIILRAKKTLPNGDVVPIYSEGARIHGQRIFWTGLLFFALGMYIRFFLWG